MTADSTPTRHAHRHAHRDGYAHRDTGTDAHADTLTATPTPDADPDARPATPTADPDRDPDSDADRHTDADTTLQRQAAHPVADAQVKSDSATTNYGSLGSLRTREETGGIDLSVVSAVQRPGHHRQ